MNTIHNQLRVEYPFAPIQFRSTGLLDPGKFSVYFQDAVIEFESFHFSRTIEGNEIWMKLGQDQIYSVQVLRLSGVITDEPGLLELKFEDGGECKLGNMVMLISSDDVYFRNAA